MDALELELQVGFLEEAAQHLSDTEQCFLDLESASQDASIIEKIFRLAHNLKGSAKAVGFSKMGDFTHHLESLLLKIKKNELPITPAIVTLLLECNDHLSRWVQFLKSDPTKDLDSEHLIQGIKEQLLNPTQAAVEEPKEAVESFPSATQFDAIMASTTASPPPAETFQAMANVISIGNAKLEESKPAPTTIQKVQANPPEELIRVSLSRIEKLMNNVGELVIFQTVLEQQRAEVASDLVQKTISQLAKITKDIQDISMSLRMIPLKQTFQKMQRIVRDTSYQLKKTINFICSGEDTEIDKTVLDNLGDPLVHLIRNAVDHGIENAEERVLAGKPPEGTINLKAFHQGNQMIIEITDDGKGLDPEILKRKAFEKGLLSNTTNLTKEQAQALIFLPGFSTKSEVTEISGRGVGMDVVKTNIEKNLQGQVHLKSEVGKGSCFQIKLPLTLAIIDGLVVTANQERYIIPLTQINESIKPQADDINYITGIGEFFNIRGQNIPLYRLQKLLNIKNQNLGNTVGIAVIIHDQEHIFAILVDDIISQQQIVIKQLGKEINYIKGFSGGAILGDGKTSLILDLPEMVRSKAQVFSKPQQASRAA